MSGYVPDFVPPELDPEELPDAALELASYLADMVVPPDDLPEIPDVCVDLG